MQDCVICVADPDRMISAVKSVAIQSFRLPLVTQVHDSLEFAPNAQLTQATNSFVVGN